MILTITKVGGAFSSSWCGPNTQGSDTLHAQMFAVWTFTLEQRRADPSVFWKGNVYCSFPQQAPDYLILVQLPEAASLGRGHLAAAAG